ncbi:MarR family transcriptional regulator [bacterium]|nr:MarR family transcriptional regulator [bacterium]
MSSISADLDTMLGETLRILTQALGNICQRSTLREASDGEITQNQLSILMMLRRRDHLTATELARILNISNAAITKIIDRLATLDLVSREPHPSDRRSMSLVMRPAGHRFLDRYDEITARKLAVILEDFDSAEKEQLLGFIRRIVQSTLANEQDVDLICYTCGGRCGDPCVLQHRRGSCSLQPDKGD